MPASFSRRTVKLPFLLVLIERSPPVLCPHHHVLLIYHCLLGASVLVLSSDFERALHLICLFPDMRMMHSTRLAI